MGEFKLVQSADDIGAIDRQRVNAITRCGMRERVGASESRSSEFQRADAAQRSVIHSTALVAGENPLVMVAGTAPAIVLRAYSQIPYVRNDLANDDYSRRANDLIFALKNSDSFNPSPGIVKSYAELFAEHTHDMVMPWFRESLVIPLPGSDPAPTARNRFKTYFFAKALQARFGGQVWQGLGRKHAVTASHLSESRPTVANHAASFVVSNVVSATAPVVLVDDVLTRGTTAVAAAKVLREAGHTGRVSVVCAGHTPLKDEIPEEDVEWTIAWRAGQPYPMKRRMRVHTKP